MHVRASLRKMSSEAFRGQVWGLGLSCSRFTCDPKPYNTVGYDPLVRGSNP